MAGYLGNSDDLTTQVVDFNYTHFLCEPREENWTLFTLLMVKLTCLFRHSAPSSASYFSNENFTRSVCRSLSLFCSDVSNLATLINEAKKRRIKQLNISLPYALDDLELRTLRNITNEDVAQFQTDREYLRVRFK